MKKTLKISPIVISSVYTALNSKNFKEKSSIKDFARALSVINSFTDNKFSKPFLNHSSLVEYALDNIKQEEVKMKFLKDLQALFKLDSKEKITAEKVKKILQKNECPEIYSNFEIFLTLLQEKKDDIDIQLEEADIDFLYKMVADFNENYFQNTFMKQKFAEFFLNLENAVKG